MNTARPILEAKSWRDWIQASTFASAQIEQLPSIAYADWSQQAAYRLAPLPGVTGAATLLARTGGSETITLEVDAIGVAAGRGEPTLEESRTLGVLSRIDAMAGAGRLGLDALTRGIPGLWGMSEDPVTLTAWAEFGASNRALVVHLALDRNAAVEHRLLCLAIDSLLPMLATKAAKALGQDAGPPNWLTNKERLVLDHLILGQSVREIADVLGRSPHTVHDHVKSLHRKLGATSRGALIARALGTGADHEDIRVRTHASRLSTGPLVAQPAPSQHHMEPKPGVRATPLGTN